MKQIVANFQVDLLEVEEDYPDQQAEYRTDVLSRELRDFIERVAEAHCESPEERDVVLWRVAEGLLDAFRSRAESALLCARLNARQPLRSLTEGEKTSVGLQLDQFPMKIVVLRAKRAITFNAQSWDEEVRKAVLGVSELLEVVR